MVVTGPTAVHVLDTARKMLQVPDLLELTNVGRLGMSVWLEQMDGTKGQLVGLESIADQFRRSNLPYALVGALLMAGQPEVSDSAGQPFIRCWTAETEIEDEGSKREKTGILSTCRQQCLVEAGYLGLEDGTENCGRVRGPNGCKELACRC